VNPARHQFMQQAPRRESTIQQQHIPQGGVVNNSSPLAASA
jgi:hypothetical protein